MVLSLPPSPKVTRQSSWLLWESKASAYLTGFFGSLAVSLAFATASASSVSDLRKPMLKAVMEVLVEDHVSSPPGVMPRVMASPVTEPDQEKFLALRFVADPQTLRHSADLPSVPSDSELGLDSMLMGWMSGAQRWAGIIIFWRAARPVRVWRAGLAGFEDAALVSFLGAELQAARRTARAAAASRAVFMSG